MEIISARQIRINPEISDYDLFIRVSKEEMTNLIKSYDVHLAKEKEK
ncbi:MAG: hypothetical protein AABY22_31160 [Nanoarchaeota archaeon]